MRIEPFRVVALYGRGRAGKRAALERRPLRLRQRPRRKAPAAQRRDLRDIVAAFAMQHADDHCARGRFADEPCRRRLAAQRVVEEPGDSGAVGRTGKAVRQPPILERVSRRPPARFDLGKDLDRGGKAGGRRHEGAPLAAAVISSPVPAPQSGVRRAFRGGERTGGFRGRHDATGRRESPWAPGPCE